MKTCYGGYCYDHGEIKVDSPSVNTILVVAAIAVTLVATTMILNDVSLGTSLTDIEYMNFIPDPMLGE